MTGIKFDADRVAGYAKLTSTSADTLDDGARLVNATPLGEESFGSLGTTVRIDEAYDRAANLLREQLARAVAALNSAAEGLADVTAGYQGSDDDGVGTIKRGEQA